MTEAIRWADKPRPCHWCGRLALALDEFGRPAHAGCAAKSSEDRRETMINNWRCPAHIDQAVTVRGAGCDPCHEDRLRREAQREHRRRERRRQREIAKGVRRVILFCQ